jgi:hypothetical protein
LTQAEILAAIGDGFLGWQIMSWAAAWLGFRLARVAADGGLDEITPAAAHHETIDDHAEKQDEKQRFHGPLSLLDCDENTPVLAQMRGISSESLGSPKQLSGKDKRQPQQPDTSVTQRSGFASHHKALRENTLKTTALTSVAKMGGGVNGIRTI